MKLDRGMLLLSLWPTTNNGGYWSPTDAIVDKLYELKGIGEMKP